MKRLLFVAFACVLCSQLPLRATSPVVISEFMASNTRSLVDETGQYPDWIEIHNVSSNTINLLNWSLTDSAGDLTKWQFPATNLAAGQFMIIFASSPEQRIPGAPLHTGFVLSAGGEYLALVDPNGVIASQFAPAFPPQAPDVSFGFGLLTSNTSLVATGAPVRLLVPSMANGGSTLDYTWTGAETNEPFGDGTWREGVTGVGFSQGTSLVGPDSMTVRFNFDAAPSANVILDSKPSGVPRNGVNAGAAWAASSTDTSPTPITRSGVMQFNAAESDQISLAGSAEFNTNRGTIMFWMRSAGATGAGQFGAMLVDRRASTGVGSGDVIVQQDDGRIFVQAGSGGGTVVNTFSSVGSVADNRWHHVAYVYDQTASGGIAIYIDGLLSRQQNNSAAWSWTASQPFELGRSHDPFWRRFNGFMDDFRIYNRQLSPAEIAAIHAGDAGVSASDLGTDIAADMLNLNSSAFIRLPFVVDNPTNFSLLTLRMKYDDGFHAWINGREITRANAPDPLAWNSAATSIHAPSLAESIPIGNPAAVLRAGTNILAIQGLNISAGNGTFLILPELSATTVVHETTNGVYFTTPTPGAANLGGTTTPGPAIAEAQHTPNVPLDLEDLIVTARVTPTFYAVSNVTLRYRIMFATEVSVPMFDDGAHGDGLASDGVFGASIPASASTNGQMIRYFISAADVRANVSRWPLFTDPANTAEYLGTVVNPGYVTSKLPIFHLFAPATVLQPGPPTSQIGADSESGGRVSFFYDGEFYDNIYMEIRGNTSAGQQKKSHRLEFNREHPFRHLEGYPRIRKTSLMAEFLDPAYIRQHLCFWLLEQMGVPSPFFYPVRAQLNGSFYALVFHNDVIGQEQVQRMGYDPNGALYKAAGNVLISRSSTGVFQKLEPDGPPDYTDYNQLCNGIVETATAANRRIAAYDMLDIPQVINYLAGARWCAENDDVWANMSLYRDTYGDQLWRIIPFDMNASWGQRYGGITPLDATVDSCKSHPLYGGATIIACDGGSYNRIYDVVIALPELRQMLLRRQRTVLDRWVMEPGVAPESRLLESHIRHMTNLIWTEAFLDRGKWGYSTWTASNKPLTNAVTELFNEFINLRRIHFSVTHNATNVAKPIGINRTNNAGIPVSQPANAFIALHSVEFSPSSGDQEQEFVCLTNTTGLALEISGWKLEGAVDFTFAQGTVVPAFTALYVSPNVKAFRARTTGPRGGQGLFVVGSYSGRLSARGEAVRLINGLGIQLQELSYQGSPSPAQQFLRVTELMYNPPPVAGNTNDAQEFEYIEVMNISTSQSINLTGVRFINGIEFDFTTSGLDNQILPPGQRVALAKNVVAFGDYYGWNAPIVVGQYTGSLDNGGERIRLVDAAGEEILDFTYNNSWYPITDGHGFSLAIVDEDAEPDAWGSRSQWRAGRASPSFPNPPLPVIPPVLINELLSASVLPQKDTIELHNPTGSPVDVGNWSITDDFATPRKFVIPLNTVIPPGGFVVFDEDDFNAGGTGFAFSSNDDEAWLFSADGTSNLSGYAHGFSFSAAEPGVPFGRYMTSTGEEHFVAQAAQTFGAANAGPKVGPIVINEIMYRPPEVGTNDNSADEFIELRNISVASVLLYDPGAPTNTWRLTEGVDFIFPANITLAAGEFALVANFNPTDAAALAAFRARYDVPVSVQIFGPYGGQLDNSGERVELKKPNPPVAGNVSYVLVDEVEYSDAAPWPAGADGFGLSLQRINASAYGNDPINWQASVPTTASASASGGTPPVISTQPEDSSVLLGDDALITVIPAGTGPISYQWRLNGVNLPNATNSFLALSRVQAEQAGSYSVVVYNDYGSQLSSNALLKVILPAFIGSHPLSLSLRGSTNNADYGFTTNNATFSASAASLNGTITYQWRFNGVEIPGATNPTLTINNVNLSHDGIYDVLITDDLGTTASDPARLAVLLSPRIAVPPALSINVVTGATFTLSVAVTGNPFPLGYEWRQGSIARASNAVNSLVNFVTLTAPTNLVTNQIWRVIVRNVANQNPTAFAQTLVSTFLDTDGDGLADPWESAYGFNPNSSADGNLDSDGDGVSNRAEYIAGTDPTNSLSYLKINSITAGVGATLTFGAASNKTYTVEYSDALGGGPWLRLTNLLAPSVNRVETLFDAGFATNRYYRIVTPHQP